MAHTTGATPWQATRWNWGSCPPSRCNPSRWNSLDIRTPPRTSLATRNPLVPLGVADIERPCSAHAGYAPWEGVNALDAAFVAYAGISALRQQIRPEQRVHGVISGRDWAPNGTFSFPTPPPIYFRHASGMPPCSLLGKRRTRRQRGRERKRNVRVISDANFFFLLFYVLTVIPDYAKMSWSVRADAWDTLEALRDRVVHCFGCARRYSLRLSGRVFD